MNIQMCTEFHIAEFEGIPQRKNRVVSVMKFCEMSPIIIYIYIRLVISLPLYPYELMMDLISQDINESKTPNPTSGPLCLAK